MNRQQPKLFALGVIALALLMLLTVPVAANELRGTLTTVEPDDLWFVLTDEYGAEHGFHMSVIGKVLVNDDELHISDLQVGDEVNVTYEIDKDEMVATLVRCTRQ